MNDSLGDRIKSNYEDRSRYFLPRRTYTIIRLDGKAFHTYTRGLKKPFDMDLIEDMNEATKFLCENIQGCVLGYTQSDEISLLLVDFDKPTTSAWFDGNVQKMSSISASMVTAKFNELRAKRGITKLAFFDSRVFTISDRIEVMNYFIWRQNDAVRNSVSMAAQSVYSHKELNGKNGSDKQEMLFQKGINWNDYPVSCKNGTMLTKKKVTMKHLDPKPGQPHIYERSNWEYEGALNFRTFLPKFLPEMKTELEVNENIA
jgi:tRNA(His) guanylyltransferase